jgi:hypothetical protein
MYKMLLVICMFTLPTYVWAEDDTSYKNYDSIVNELKASIDEKPAPTPSNDDIDWQEIALHAGVGAAMSWVGLNAPNGSNGSGLLKGIELNFGMNLFSRVLRAEGAFSTFAQEDIGSNLKADLKEFELRLLYLPAIQEHTVLRFGFGLAARYMNLETNSGASYQASTPSSVVMVGFEQRISNSVTLGPDISYRSAIVTDTFDKSAWDTSLRLNATF